MSRCFKGVPDFKLWSILIQGTGNILRGEYKFNASNYMQLWNKEEVAEYRRWANFQFSKFRKIMNLVRNNVGFP